MDFSDVLGSVDDVRVPAPYGSNFSLDIKDIHHIDRGVTVPWLVQAFHMKRADVVRLLDGCPTIASTRAGQKMYDLRTAAARLVKPKIDIRKYIEQLDSKDLPENLRKEFWTARLAEQKARQNAGDLWRSEDVLMVIGEIFKTIKDRSLLWAETVATKHGITEEQRQTFIGLRDDMLKDVDVTVRALAKKQITPSQLAEFDDSAEA